MQKVDCATVLLTAAVYLGWSLALSVTRLVPMTVFLTNLLDVRVLARLTAPAAEITTTMSFVSEVYMVFMRLRQTRLPQVALYFCGLADGSGELFDEVTADPEIDELRRNMCGRADGHAELWTEYNTPMSNCFCPEGIRAVYCQGSADGHIGVTERDVWYDSTILF